MPYTAGQNLTRGSTSAMLSVLGDTPDASESPELGFIPALLLAGTVIIGAMMLLMFLCALALNVNHRLQKCVLRGMEEGDEKTRLLGQLEDHETENCCGFGLVPSI